MEERKAILEHLFGKGIEPFLHLLDVHPTGILAVHRRQVVFANKFIKQIVGYEPEEVIGKSTKIFFPDEESWRRFGERLYRFLDQQKDRVIQVAELKRKDGSKVKVRAITVPVQKINGSWLVLSTIEDVSWEENYLEKLESKTLHFFEELKRQNEKLERQKAFLAELLENLPVGLALLNEGAILYRNQLSQTHFEEKKIYEILALLKEEKNYAKVFEEGDRKIFCQLTSIDKDHELLISQDITYLCKIHQDLEGLVEAKVEARLARERLIMLGRITAELMHEINTPLSFMKTNLQVFGAYLANLKKLIQGVRLDTETEKRLEKIFYETGEISKSLEMGVERIASIVQSVRSLSKQQTSEKEAISIAQVLKEALTLTWNRTKRYLKILVNGKPYSLQRFDFPFSFKVKATKAGLVQMVVILVNNTLEAAKERRIRDAHLKIEVFPTEKYLILAFRDNCGGVPEENLKRLFKDFYTTKKEGSGLGLYILKELAKEMDAVIEVRNVKNPAGLEVRLFLPLVESEQEIIWPDLKPGPKGASYVDKGARP